MKFGVIVFPGSNCDHDAYWTVQHVAKQPATMLWHESHDLENCDVIIVPGGFYPSDKMPFGIQFLGRALNDGAVIAAAHVFQTHSEWHTRRPPLA